MEQYDILIIGAGPAGMTAAIYGQRAGYRTLILEEAVLGGQIANTPEVENYPAVGKISGVELGMNLYNQVIEQGAQIEFDGVVSAQLEGTEKRLTTQSGKVYAGRAVIIANGAKRRKLGIPGEETYAGRGVSYCATCDGGFFKGKPTVVIGGGNTALEDALYLANLCTQVHLIHRRDAFRGSKVLVDRLHQNEVLAPVNGNISVLVAPYDTRILVETAPDALPAATEEQEAPATTEMNLSQDPAVPEHKIGRYRHFKGNEYRVIGFAKHSETLEEMVVYEELYGDHGLWVRPADQFFEIVDINGVLQPRFAYLGD